MGYDFLAIRALVARGHISGVGRQIGVGKESDIFEVGAAAIRWQLACC
jgi:RIO kinase 2